MTDVTMTTNAPVRRINLEWIPAVFFTPRRVFKQITGQSKTIWLTPLLFTTLTALILVAVTGPIRLAAAQNNIVLPPDFQNYSPEMQAQTLQASQATQGPVFIYVFPSILAIARVWLGWLLVGGLLHLVLTLFGGRSSAGSALNLVAWAALPFALRDIIRIIAAVSTHTLIANPGLSGFAPAGGRLALFVGKLLATLDIYLVWHILLLVLGVRLATGLNRGKTWGAVLITMLVGVGLEAALGFVSALLSGVSVTRPFFF
jgi:hypothetical protein